MGRTFSTLTSPYNFVPLAKEIIFPEWGNRVTQDIPFSDALDGELSLKITLETPTFIRNGSASKDTKDSEKEKFFKEDQSGAYFIPGSSLKGMIRNVLEIASFGKMQNITDTRYAVRDMNLQQYTKLFSKNQTAIVKAGWLDISSPDWTITPCEFARVERSLFSPDFGNEKMSGSEKYKQYYREVDRSLKASVSISDKKMTGNGLHYLEVVKLRGPIAGRFVFTGQPQECKPGDIYQKKHQEFFFYAEKNEDRFLVDGDPALLQKDEYGEVIRPKQQDFVNIHTEQTSSQDWRKWKEIRRDSSLYRDFDGRIPVFYLTDENGNLESFGLAMLFRLAGKVSTAEAARNTNPDHFPVRGADFKPDMADLIFGYTTPKSSLRGRVQFSPCRALPETIMDEPQLEERILGTPKASFYPGYIRQSPGMTEKDKYKTYLSPDAELRGWKRYPVLNPLATEQPNHNSGSEKQITRFQPLPAGVEFVGKVRIHNLRVIEFGALLWALTLGNSEYRRHSLGMAKAYGFGVVRIEITDAANLPLEAAKEAFNDYMKQQIGEKWLQSPSIKALVDMATYYRKDSSGKLEKAQTHYDFHYLPTPRDYQLAKGNRQTGEDSLYLEEYTLEALRRAPAAPRTSAVAEAPLARSEARVFLDNAAKIHSNQKEMEKQFSKVTSATAEELDELRRLLNREGWFKTGFSLYAKKIASHMEELKK